MLIRYKKDFEKIAMGLLSFVPELKDVKALQKTIKVYEENPTDHLYLWRDDDDVVGAIGVKIDEEHAVIQHIAVNPSFRNLGIGKQMITALMKLHEDELIVIPSAEIEPFYKRCFEETGLE